MFSTKTRSKEMTSTQKTEEGVTAVIYESSAKGGEGET